MKQYKVGIIGGTGMVGQRFVTLMEDHPWFQLTAIAASPRSAGKTYEQAVSGRWAMKTPIPQQAKDYVDFLEAHIDHIPYLHFKNVSGEVRKQELDGALAWDDPKMDDIMCDLEDGIIDYEAYRDLLDRLNFQGVGIIEQDCPHATTQEAFEKAKKNLVYLQKIHLIP